MGVWNLTVKQFNELVKYLKRLDDLGDDFYLHKDAILPSVRTPKNRPGKHIIRSRIPTLPEYDDIVYGIAKLSETSRDLGDVKGKKTTIFMEQTEKGIWITINDLTKQLAGVYGEEDQDMIAATAPTGTFDEYLKVVEFKSISQDALNDMKRGDILCLEDDRHTTKVRIARDLFKLKGVSRLTIPVNYEVEYHVSSPVPASDTVVIGSSKNGMLTLHFMSPVIEALHYYTFSPFY